MESTRYVRFRHKANSLRVFELPYPVGNVAAETRRALRPNGRIFGADQVCNQCDKVGAIVATNPCFQDVFRKRHNLTEQPRVLCLSSNCDVIANFKRFVWYCAGRERPIECKLNRGIRFERCHRNTNPVQEHGLVQLINNARGEIQLLLVVSDNTASKRGLDRGRAVDQKQDVSHRVAPICSWGGRWRRGRRRGRGGCGRRGC